MNRPAAAPRRETCCRRAPILGALALFLAACAFPGSVKLTVKIGLAAPFEGLHRDLGYEVLHAVRLAVRQRNAAGGVGERYLVELVALNDLNEAEEAAQQAREMAADPGVLGVIGGWSPETAQAARGEYDRLGILFVTPAYDPELLAAEAARVAVSGLAVGQAVILCAPHSQHEALGGALASRLADRAIPVDLLCDKEHPQWMAPSLLGGGQPDLLFFVAADTAVSAEWVRLARKAGHEGSILGGPSLGSALVPMLAGEASEGILFVSHLPPASQDPAFLEGYLAQSGGSPPGPLATWSYEAANRLLDALDRAVAADGRPARAGVLEALASEPLGVLPVSVYRIEGGRIFAPSGF